jgi:deoxyadenosine/deoxycytidine kinase
MAVPQNAADALPCSHDNIFVIAAEGSIAAGKSNFVENVLTKENIKAFFKQYSVDLTVHVEVVDEPVQKWQDSGALSSFYASPSTMGGPFQMCTFSTRIGEFAKGYYRALSVIMAGKADCAYIVVERSWLTDRYVFKDALTASGMITPVLSKMYDQMYEAWEATVGYRQPDVILYLDVPVEKRVEVFMGRVEKRKRPGEIVSEAYQKTLCEQHDKIYGAGVFNGVPIIKVDALVDFTSRDSPASRALAHKIMDQIMATAEP